MENKKHEPMSPDLLRQRRNLLITSLALVAINLAGATLKKDDSLFGTSLEFSNPERIIWGIWIIWGYFLVRYWQYFNEEENLGIHKAMGDWIKRKIIFDESDYEYTYWISWQYLIFWKLLSQHKNAMEYEYSVSNLEPQNKITKAFWTLQAFVSVATKTPRFTDYLMPFLVALCPLLIKLWDIWKSRLV